MRISIIESDPGYVADGMFYRVELNGSALQGCVTADEERGEVLVWDMEWVRLGEPRTKRLAGVVRVVRDEGDGVRYAEGTVGFIDPEDRVWAYAEPSNPDYEAAKRHAQLLWDHQAHRWYSPRHQAIH